MIPSLVSGIPRAHDSVPRVVDDLRSAGVVPPTTTWRAPLPLPPLIDPDAPRRPPIRYEVRRMDKSGRLMARPLLDYLGWPPRQRLEVRLDEGVLTLTPGQDCDDTVYIDNRAHLRLRARLRRDLAVQDADDFLLAADPTAATLMMFTPIAVAALLRPWTAPLEEDHPA